MACVKSFMASQTFGRSQTLCGRNASVISLANKTGELETGHQTDLVLKKKIKKFLPFHFGMES